MGTAPTHEYGASELLIVCPECGTRLFAGVDWLGEEAECDRCGGSVPVDWTHPSPDLAPLQSRKGALELHGFDMHFRFMPAGAFTQGSVSGYRDEQPLRMVYLTHCLWVAATPVTQASFERVMHFNPSVVKGADLPVENLSWHQACDFCYCLAEQACSEGVLPDSIECRLPTEAEWEYLAQSATPKALGVSLGESAWYRGNSGGGTQPVGQKHAAGNGLYDVLGNVREWCLDWIGRYTPDHPVNPYGPDSGDKKVIKGGSFLSMPWRCRPSDRLGMSPSSRHRSIGFRPVLIDRHECQ